MDSTGTDEANSSEFVITPDKKIVFSGYLTKQGRFRKNWKRRHFELTEDHKLRYYKQSKSFKLAGTIDLQTCTVIKPGGHCPTKFINIADPACCFGIMTKDRRFYCYAETRQDLKMWLDAFAEHVPEGVNVTTPEDIIASWPQYILDNFKHRQQHDDDKDFSVRLSVFLNGSKTSGRVVAMPTSLDLLLARCSVLFHKALTKAFTNKGQLIESSRDIKNDDIIVVAGAGEDCDLEATLPIQARQLDDQAADSSDDSDSESDEEDISQVLHRLNTEILPLEAKPGYKAKKGAINPTKIINRPVSSAASTPAKPNVSVECSTTTAAAEKEEEEEEAEGYQEPVMRPQNADNDDSSSSSSSSSEDEGDNYDNSDYAEPVIRTVEHEAGYLDPENDVEV